MLGGGIAGLAATLAAVPRARVLVVSKGPLEAGCTPLAQGGIAAAVGPDDSPDLHFRDTLAAGRGLCDELAVRLLVEEAPARVAELERWGVAFDRAGGALDLHREAAHSRARVLHAGGDATGAVVERVLLERLRRSGAAVAEGQAATRLVVGEAGCVGVELSDLESGRRWRVSAAAVVLATGGAAALWRLTTNPAGATGDGVALAYRAGADVADLEFVQFHPTVAALPGAPPFLVSEAVRGEGGLVVNAAGRRFLFDADPRGELAPRDVVARAIAEELACSGSDTVLLDCRPLADGFEARFPTVAGSCRRHGLDPATTPIPIAPAAHYTIGGVVTDLDGATTVPGLYACGEVARTGVHGANRLASNSLLEGLVFGRRAGLTAAAACAGRVAAGADELPGAPATPSLGDIAAAQELRELMWSACGISRTGAGLRAALAVIDRMGEERRPSLPALGLTTARLVCEAALHREESRGAHHRSDFPTSSDRWHGSRVMRSQRGDRLDCDPATHR